MPALLISTSRVFISSAACRIWEVLVTSSVRGVTRLSGCCRALRVPAYTFFAPRRSASLRRSEEHTSELQSRLHLVCRLLLEKKKKIQDDLPIRVETMNRATGALILPVRTWVCGHLAIILTAKQYTSLGFIEAHHHGDNFFR